MRIEEVKDIKVNRDFINAPKAILGDDPNYIAALDTDTINTFSDKNNLTKRGGKFKLWVVKSDEGKLIGRIAAFVNPKYKNKIPVGGVGFFDSIDDQKVADLLLDTSRDWLKEQGMEAMDGPINFGERDRFWGVMVEGFIPPVYGMHYAKPYYHKLLENYGFQLYFYQLCYGMGIEHEVPEKFFKKYEMISKDPKFTIRLVTKDKLPEYARAFTKVYNAAWASHGGGKSMSERQAQLIFKSMKPIIDPNIAYFCYYGDEPVGMWINIPDINGILKNFNGKFGPIQKAQFFVNLKRKKCVKAFGIIFGVVPEFQNKGVDALMIVEGSIIIKGKTNYKQYELQWVGDFNPKMLNVARSLEGDMTRKLGTYRYLFDRSAPFERHPMIS